MILIFKVSPIYIFLIVLLSGCGKVSGHEGVRDLMDEDKKAISGLAQDKLDDAVATAARAFFEAAPQSAGLSVGVIAGGKIKTYHFGTTTLGRSEKPTNETIYAIASITKTVTGSLLARAAIDGRLALDDDIRDYLSGSFPNLEFNGQPVNIAHLLNHQSGLPHIFPDLPEMHHAHPSYQGDPLPWMAYVTQKLTNYGQDDFFRDLHAVQLNAAPGTHFSYSNVSVQLAGLILEQVYDRPLQVLVDSLVAQPLAMRSTTLTPGADELERFATGYDDQGRPMPRDLTASGAAGGLVSTITDLTRYAQWHLDESDRVVQLSHTASASTNDGPEMGLGWYIERSAENVRRLSCDGTVPGFSSRLVLYPELGIGASILTNQLDWSIPELTDRLAHDILASLNPQAFTHEEAR